MLFLLLFLSVICQAEPWTERFTIDLEPSTGSQKQNFFIKRNRNTLSASPSDITEANGYAGSDSPPDYRQHKHFSYGVKTSIIESTSWQWLYTTNLLVAYELVLNIKDTPLDSNPYSWLPVEVVVGWLLKSYWNPDSLLFNPIEQQTASMLKQGRQPFATINTIFGSGHNPSKYPSSESSGQQASQAITCPAGYFTHLLHSDSGNGNEGPEQDLHTLDLNCFVNPCHGVCRLRPSSFSGGPYEWTLNSEETSTDHTEAAPGQSTHPHLPCSCRSGFDSLNVTDSRQIPPFEILNELAASQCQYASCQPFQPQTHQPDDAGAPGNVTASPDDLIVINGLLNLHKHCPLEETTISFTRIHSPPPVGTSETQQTTESSQQGQNQPHFYRKDTVQTTMHRGQRTCEVTIVGKNGQLRVCGKAFRNTKSLSAHKRKYHTGQKTCHLFVVGKNHQPHPCGTVCKNAQALTDHKRRHHTEQQTCIVTIIGENGQQRLCGKVLENARALSMHKSKYHTGQKTCNEIVVGQDRQPRPCGAVCKNLVALSAHKSRFHKKQQTCLLPVAGGDGQLQPCGRVCISYQALKDHKRRHHSGQKTCDVNVVEQDGQQRPCGKIYKNAKALSTHKSSIHREQKACQLTMIGEGGQQRPCGKVCKNPQALLNHKRTQHSGQQTCSTTVVGKDGQQRPCAEVCNNAQVLSEHKRTHHTGQKTCDVTVVEEDGRQWPCRKLCKSAKALSDHKRTHRKRKPVDGGLTMTSDIKKVK